MEYKNNWKEVIERQNLFWKRKLKNRILARICLRNAPFEEWLAVLKNKIPLASSTFPEKETVLKTWELRLSILKELQDDSLPVMKPTEFDEGLFGGIFGAATHFNYDPESGWMGSMAEHFLVDSLDSKRLDIKKHGIWMKELKERFSWYSERAEGRFGLSPIVSIDALNFAVLARGATQAMLDTCDNPDKLKELHKFALQLNIEINRLQKEFIRPFNGGTFDGHPASGAWFPGDEVNLSVDAFGQCSRDVYLELGFKYNQELINAFGSAALHIHINAEHLLPEVIKLKGLKCISLFDETPRYFPRLKEIKKVTGDMPLITDCMLDEFLDGMKNGRLEGGVFYVVKGHSGGRCNLMSPAVETVKEANELMKKVHAYRTVN